MNEIEQEPILSQKCINLFDLIKFFEPKFSVMMQSNQRNFVEKIYIEIERRWLFSSKKNFHSQSV